MKKQRQALSSKKPPVPSDDHSVIDDWMNSSIMPAMQDLVKQADQLIRDNIPDCHFAIKWGYAYYGNKELGWLVELTPFAVSTNIVFLSGAMFNPTPPLGEGDTSRYVKLKSEAELLSDEVKGYLEQASDYPGWK